jgi:hypothetical protein
MKKYKIITLYYPNSRHPIEKKLIILQSLTKSEIDELDNKYNREILQISLNTNNDIAAREQQIKKIENKKICELALMFIINKPKSNLDDQIKLLSNNFYAGWIIQIIQNGYILSDCEFA